MIETASFIALVGVVGYLSYELYTRRKEVERLKSERDYYYRLAVNYYNTALTKNNEAESVKKNAQSLKKQFKVLQGQLQQLRKERKEIEKILREVLKRTGKSEKMLEQIMKLTESMTRLSNIEQKLDLILSKANSDNNKIASEIRKELREVKKLEAEIKRTIEKLANQKVVTSSQPDEKIIEEFRSRFDNLIQKFEEELNYYGASFSNAVTKMTNIARSNDELYRVISSERGENFERLALPIILVKNNRVIGKIRSDDVYHVGGYAPFDFIIFVHDYPEKKGKKVKRVKRMIFAEMKTGYSSLSDYEFEFAKKILRLKSDFIKYGIVRLVKESDYYGREVWRVYLEIIDDEKRLKELKKD